MKFLIIFALVLATASAFSLRGEEVFPRELVVPVVEEVEAEGRITNGHNAREGEFPYQVGLSLKVSALSSAWCGASLIDHEWVLTAAHCTDGIEEVTVYLGSTKRTKAEVKHTVNKRDIIIHAGWNSKTLKNDISLIRIPSVKYTDKIKPVRFHKTYSSYANDYVVASGWGRTSDSSSSVATDLQWARMRVITNTACAKTYGATITSSNICVSTPDHVSTCNGDSGGPLVLEGTDIQVGLTSFGSATGCEKGYHAVFTRVSSYLDWIGQHASVTY